jgi:hypothetical protein
MPKTTAIVLLTMLGSAAEAGECTIDSLRQDIDAWDRTADTAARKAIAEGLNACKDDQGIPRIVRSEREPRHPTQCAACGMKPTVDPVTGVWRPYRQ